MYALPTCFFGNCLLYTFFEFIGVALAVVFYWIVCPEEENSMCYVNLVPTWVSAIWVIYAVLEFIGATLAVDLYWIVGPEEGNSKIKGLDPLVAKLVSDFLGALMLVLTVPLNDSIGSTSGVCSIAASLMCVIFSLGIVSGAHFNLAVTVAIMCGVRDRCTPMEGSMSMVVQILDCLCAVFTYSAMKDVKTFCQWYRCWLHRP